MSYDPAKGQQTLGHATVVGRNLAGTGGLQLGIWGGSQALAQDKALAGLNSDQANENSFPRLFSYSAGYNFVPLYTFHHDGLGQAAADARAVAIATDIAKRESTLSVEVDGMPGLSPSVSLTVQGLIDAQFANTTYYVYSYEHSFSMPQGRSAEAGYLTTIKAITLPVYGEEGALG